MPIGLDKEVLEKIDWEEALAEVLTDTKSDFLLAPYFTAVFSRAGDDLIAQASADLSAGRYAPNLPITTSVPKSDLLTRPGSILRPVDRLVYQGLIKVLLPDIENAFDRDRSFSHVPAGEGAQLFQPSHTSWHKFQESIDTLCQTSNYILRTDIANFFQSISQHALINSLESDGCPPSAVRLLEEMLYQFTERRSSGIIQGVYPSDVLGNYYLTAFDARLAMAGLDSARYVDDIYIGFDSELDGKRFLVDAIGRLRADGLELNQAKTALLPAEDMRQEERAVDKLFEDARQEVSSAAEELAAGGYGFQGDWINEDDLEGAREDDYDLIAVRALLNFEDDNEGLAEKIDRFCLPLLRGARDPAGIERCFDGLKRRPHLTRLYFSYLTYFTRRDEALRRRVERLVRDNGFFIDYQRMYHLAGLLPCDEVATSTVNAVLRWLQNPKLSSDTRAICAIFCAKFGNGAVRGEVRDLFSTAPDPLKFGVLYSARYFPRNEKGVIRKAWGSTDSVCALIAKAR